MLGVSTLPLTSCARPHNRNNLRPAPAPVAAPSPVPCPLRDRTAYGLSGGPGSILAAPGDRRPVPKPRVADPLVHAAQRLRKASPLSRPNLGRGRSESARASSERAESIKGRLAEELGETRLNIVRTASASGAGFFFRISWTNVQLKNRGSSLCRECLETGAALFRRSS